LESQDRCGWAVCGHCCGRPISAFPGAP